MDVIIQLKKLKLSAPASTPIVTPLAEPAPQKVERKSVCWWDAHPFEGPSVRLPTRYDSKTDTFYGIGHFCGFECAFAYMNDTAFFSLRREHYTGLLNTLFSRLVKPKVEHDDLKAQKTTTPRKNNLTRPFPREPDTPKDIPRSLNVRPAPPRMVLKLFGGELDIEEFRSTHATYRLFELPVIPWSVQVEACENAVIRMRDPKVFKAEQEKKRDTALVDKMRKLKIVK